MKDRPDTLLQDDDIVWKNDAPQAPSKPVRRPWKVLVADDDDAVHRITALVLADTVVLGRRVQLLAARSAAQALEQLRTHPDTALVLLDVVMESEDAGLRAVRLIREELRNEQVRIVLRTGQPGHAPEREVVSRYEIDGYEAKTEISAQRLVTVVTASLRAYDLISASRAKSEFLANMSHELRTPMHAILSFVEIAQTRINAGEIAPARAAHYLARIHDSGRRLMRLLDDLLDVAKLEDGSMRYDLGTHGMDRIIEGAVGEFDQLLGSGSIACVVRQATTDVRVYCDAFRIGQVMRNLLSNAIKYTPAGKTITVTMTDDDGCARVDVIDQGMGIPEGEQDTIFDKFVQSSKTRSGAGGTGLGLTICREIIEQHGGAISARNLPEGGACFSFTVPRPAFGTDGEDVAPADAARGRKTTRLPA